MEGLLSLKPLKINVYFALFQSVLNNNHTILILIFFFINWILNCGVKKEFIDGYIKNLLDNSLSLKFTLKLETILTAGFYANK